MDELKDGNLKYLLMDGNGGQPRMVLMRWGFDGVGLGIVVGCLKELSGESP